MLPMLLLILTSGFVVPDRSGPDRFTMQEVLVERVSELLEERFSGQKIRIELTPRWIPGQLLRLSPDQLRRIELAGPPDRHATVDVMAESRGENTTFQARFALELEQRLPVAIRRLEAGDIIESDDLELSWIPVARSENRLTKTSDEMIGRTLRTVHVQGQPFLETDVMAEPVVDAGDPVRMIYTRGHLEIVVDGEARERGAIGDTIGFYSPETRRRYRAVVRDSHTLIWERTQ